MLLEHINTPNDLKELTYPELKALAKEIRGRIISTVSKTGGHLASNLGTVELTIALHKVFDCPQDKIVWDVGHQCYTHKLLTGRRDAFDTLRTTGGLSGFPKQSESPYDAFIAGHSGGSISAALGIARGKSMRGEPGTTIAVIGDASVSNGLAYEGMNHAGRSGERIIIIINDNEMSISKNVGSLGRYLTKIRLSQPYFELKDNAKDFFQALPIIGPPVKNAIAYGKRAVKQLVYHSNLFEDFGYKYLGPVDGHDIESLCQVLERAKEYACPCVVHVRTIKGKGYPPAELQPSRFHGVEPFDVPTGNPLKKKSKSFSKVFGDTMLELAAEHREMTVITAAMVDGTGLTEYEKQYHDTTQFYDAGIAEEHALVFAAGLSTQGIVPVFAVYSTFLQRGYDQLIHDLSIEQKHIVLAIDRAGLVGADGETHQGIFDVAMLRSIPGIRIYAPATFAQQRRMLRAAVLEETGVIAVRYPKGSESAAVAKYTENSVDNGYIHVDSGCKDILLVSYGVACEAIFSAMEKLSDLGRRVSVMQLTQIHPLPAGALEEALEYQHILFVEEAICTGSVAEGFAAALMKQNYRGRIQIKAIEHFVPHGSIPDLMADLGLDTTGIINTIIGADHH